MKGTKGPYIEALGGINLKVKKGETFGILGPNGAGKTTLIKILCTLVLHDSGEVYVNGYDVQKEPTEVLKNVQAVLPGSRGFSWRLSGRQNLEFYAQLYGLKQREAEERIRYLLEFTGLNERAEDIYQRYSTGMQRKLLLCRALLRNTPILLFDEPTVGLDVASAGEFRDLLRNEMAQGEQKTILLSTHNLVEAQEMCDRIAIIDQGKITACDTPDNIRYTLFEERPVHITFRDAWFDEKQAKTIEHLRTTEGVYGITPDIRPNNSLHGLALRVDKNLDLSHLLPILLQAELKIVTINTSEPTLEEAFIAITDQHSKIRNTRTTPRKE
jgi:ABC-2 type transport system ATP-binding protein